MADEPGTDGTIPDAFNDYSPDTPSTAGASSGSRSLVNLTVYSVFAAQERFSHPGLPAPRNRANPLRHNLFAE